MTKKFLGSEKNYIIDSPEKAYTLGFLWGDGNLLNIKNSNLFYPRLEILKEDLEQIKDLFKVWGHWHEYTRKRDNRKEQSIITLYDKDLGWFLSKYDYLIKSSNEPTKILEIIPEYLKPLWWRGWIDADGCFYFNQKQYFRQFSLAGSYQLSWEESKKLFTKLKIFKYNMQYTLNKKSKSSIIRINNKKDINLLGNYIYQDSFFIGLERKRIKYNSII